MVKPTMGLNELSERIGVSPSTIRRRVHDRRNGLDNDFPMTIFGAGKKLVWDRQIIEDWIESLASTPSTPTMPTHGSLVSKVKGRKVSKKTQRGLKELKVID